MTSRPPRFLVPRDAITDDRAVLIGAERHHLRVRRVREGDAIELLDDHGRAYHAAVTSLTRERAEVAIIDRIADARESPLDLTLAIAALKADKLDLVVEKATELGVSRIVVFTCTRGLGGCSAARLSRWQRIAASAAKQCGRSRVPTIAGPEPLASIGTRTADVRLVCWEQASAAPIASTAEQVSSVLLVIGPEGGFTADEIELLQAKGFATVSLGPRILRGETAAIAAVTLVQARWGDQPRV